MFEFAVGVGVGLILWGAKELVGLLRRPRLEVCLDLSEREREFSWELSPDSAFRVRRTVDLAVRNLGRKPAVDCVARVGSVEILNEGEWVDLQRRPQGHLAWAETDRARTATIRPSSEAPRRHLRLLRFDGKDGTLQVTIRYATPSLPAESEPPFADVPVGGFSHPVRFRLTVWVQPEGAEGRAASCRIEVDWRASEADRGRRHTIRLRGESFCDEVPARWRGLLRGLLPSG